METKTLSVLENTVVDLINKSVTSLDKGITWISGQLPDVVTQFLQWTLVYNLIVASVLFLFIVFTVIIFPYIMFRLYKKQDERGCYFSRDNYIIPSIVTIMAGGISFIPFMTHLLDAIKVYTAPKVYLIEWASNLIK